MPEPPYPLVPGEQTKSWLERHAFWKIPLGCLTLVLLLTIFIGGLLTVITSSFRHSDVYRQAVLSAQQSSEVRDLIGQPFHASWLVSGQLNVSGSTGDADLTIPIEGPRAKARIRAVATKSAGVWRFSFLKVYVNGTGRCIDLLSVQPPAERDF